MPVRLIATDIDGTLLNPENKIPEENIRAIRDAQAKGISVAIATGRFPENAFLLLREYGLSCFIIGGNGAHITDAKLNRVHEEYIDPAAVLAVRALLEKMDAEYFLFGDYWLCTSDAMLRHHSEINYGAEVESMGFRYYHGKEATAACQWKPVYKFYVYSSHPLPPLREALGKIPGISLTRSGPMNIEVMPEGVDKAKGVAALARHLGIPLEQVMTLGDEENDIPMLKIAGYGVAMGNGSQEAKAAARFVTDTNGNGGFAKAIRKYALQEE